MHMIREVQSERLELKTILEERGYGAQAALARQLEIGEAQLSKYVRGVNKPSWENKKRIARALGLKVEEIAWQ